MKTWDVRRVRVIRWWWQLLFWLQQHMHYSHWSVIMTNSQPIQSSHYNDHNLVSWTHNTWNKLTDCEINVSPGSVASAAPPLQWPPSADHSYAPTLTGHWSTVTLPLCLLLPGQQLTAAGEPGRVKHTRSKHLVTGHWLHLTTTHCPHLTTTHWPWTWSCYQETASILKTSPQCYRWNSSTKCMISCCMNPVKGVISS